MKIIALVLELVCSVEMLFGAIIVVRAMFCREYSDVFGGIVIACVATYIKHDIENMRKDVRFRRRKPTTEEYDAALRKAAMKWNKENGIHKEDI